MRAVFLADAHLRNQQDHNYQQLLKFLDEQRDLDALFLLGDIFDFWIGYRHVVFSAYLPVLQQLKRLTDSGTRIFYVEGNHDFNVGPYMPNILNATVITDRQLVEWDGQKLLLSHGDQLNTSRSYHWLRAFWRSPFIKFVSNTAHPDWVWAFGTWLSRLGDKKRYKRSDWDPTPLLTGFADSEAAQAADTLILGHFHKPLSKTVRGKKLFIIGDWITRFSYAEMSDGQISLKSYSS